MSQPQRIIKFRAWDKQLNRWNDYYERYIYEAQKIDFIELNQFTGLHDSKGQEIYEGDILAFHYMTAFSSNHGEIYEDATAEVIWCVGGAGFTLHVTRGHLHSLDMTRGELVGNIHENKDMVKS